MHIVYITKEFPPSSRAGGIGSYVKDIAHGMVEAGNKVTVVTASDDTRKSSDLIVDGIRVICLNGGDFWVENAEPGNKLKKLRVVYRFFSYRRKLKRILSAIKDADIVEVADFGAESLCLHNLDVPVVVRLHTPSCLDIPTLKPRKVQMWKLHKSLVPWAESRVLKNAKYVSGCSNAIINWVENNMVMSPRIKGVVKNPANFANNNEIENNIGSKNKSKIIFCAGTISETKGIGDLIEACRIIKAQGLDIRLLLAGKEGQYASAIKQQMQKSNEDWCIFLGKLNRTELFSYYKSADVCCFPSWWENMPMVCLEAMSCGAITIAGNSGGPTEIIFDGNDGFISPIKNPEILASIIKKALMLDKSERDTISLNARRKIQDNFDLKLIVKQMINFYSAVINDFSSQSQKHH